jgi:hypothetical protein
MADTSLGEGWKVGMAAVSALSFRHFSEKGDIP